MKNNPITQYVQNVASITRSEEKKYYIWLLENGKEYTKNHATKEDLLIYDVKKQMCYRNAMLYSSVTDNPYVEGYAYAATDRIPFAIEHAFNLNEKGQMIDLTDKKYDLEISHFFGVKVPVDYILDEYWNLDDRAKYAYTPLKAYYIQEVLKKPIDTTIKSY